MRRAGESRNEIAFSGLGIMTLILSSISTSFWTLQWVTTSSCKAWVHWPLIEKYWNFSDVQKLYCNIKSDQICNHLDHPLHLERKNLKITNKMISSSIWWKSRWKYSNLSCTSKRNLAVCYPLNFKCKIISKNVTLTIIW